MKIGFKFALLAAAFTLAVGCGPDQDPSKNNGANGDTNGTTNGDPNGSTNGDPNGSTNGDTNGGTNGSTNGGTNGQTAGPCEVNDAFFGQMSSDNDIHAGGAPTTDPIATDAGLSAVMAEFDGLAEDESATVSHDITGAIVTATYNDEAGDTIFWVQDANAAIVVFLGFPPDATPPTEETIKVGDTVDFTVTEVLNFRGTPQISVVENFAIDMDARGQSVPYTDLTGEADISVDQYYATNVRIGGRLSETSRDCGGSSCYDLMHGDQVIEYRINAEFSNTQPGDCVTYFGPLGAFPGPYNDSMTDPSPQLNVSNFDWRRTQFD